MLLGMAGLGIVGSKFSSDKHHGQRIPPTLLVPDLTLDSPTPQSGKRAIRGDSELQQIPHQGMDEEIFADIGQPPSPPTSVESEELFSQGFITSKHSFSALRLLQ